MKPDPQDSPKSGTGFSMKQILLANLVAFVFYLLFWYGVSPVIVDLHAPVSCERNLEYSFARALQYEGTKFESEVHQIVEAKNSSRRGCSIVKYAVLDERPTEVEVSLNHRVKVLAWNFHIWRTLSVPRSVEE